MPEIGEKQGNSADTLAILLEEKKKSHPVFKRQLALQFSGAPC